MNSSTFPDKSPKTASRVIDSEAVIIIPQENKVRVLNKVGSRIWELLNGSLKIDRIASVISDEFDVAYDTALHDTAEFIDDMQQKDMVVLFDCPRENADI